MRFLLLLLCTALLSCGADAYRDRFAQPDSSNIIVVGHRGAPAYRLEETYASYEIAHFQRASFLEIDLCVTKDNHLICRHDCELGITTDIALREEFAGRARYHPSRATRDLRNESTPLYFSADFTLAEIQTLKCMEKYPDTVRTHLFDFLYPVITLDEFLQFIRALRDDPNTGLECDYETSTESYHYNIGVYIETKTPAYFRELGYDMEAGLLAALQKWGYLERCQSAMLEYKDTDYTQWAKECGVLLQSFEYNLAQQLPADCPYPRVQLLSGDPNEAVPGLNQTYGDLMSPEGLQQISTWAVGIGPDKETVLNYTQPGMPSTGLVESAHSNGLLVHPYTFRPEEYFMAGNFDNNPTEEYWAFLDVGVDGFFSDAPVLAWEAIDQYQQGPSTWAYVFYGLTAFIVIAFCLLLVGVMVLWASKKSLAKKQYDTIEDGETW